MATTVEDLTIREYEVCISDGNVQKVTGNLIEFSGSLKFYIVSVSMNTKLKRVSGFFREYKWFKEVGTLAEQQRAQEDQYGEKFNLSGRAT